MTKYKATREFMNELIEWRDNNALNVETEEVCAFVDWRDIQQFPVAVDIWWTAPNSPKEVNARLIAILQWLNGEEVFEVEAPHKFIVRSKYTDENFDYNYVKVFNGMALAAYFDYATKFDTREEAQEWANSHQVVAEIDEEGNEV